MPTGCPIRTALLSALSPLGSILKAAPKPPHHDRGARTSGGTLTLGTECTGGPGKLLLCVAAKATGTVPKGDREGWTDAGAGPQWLCRKCSQEPEPMWSWMSSGFIASQGTLARRGGRGQGPLEGTPAGPGIGGLAEVGPEFNHTSISAEPLNPRTQVCGDAGTSDRDQHPPTK